MAKQTLPTNFIDDILAPSMGGKRKFTITDNGDGTYEIEDVTEYAQTGSDFGAGQINATNQAVNESCDKANVIETMDDIMANQASGMIAGAKAVAELNGDLFFKPGDTITLAPAVFDGYITDGKQRIVLSIPVGKRLDNITSAKTSLVTGILRQNNKYLVGSVESPHGFDQSQGLLTIMKDLGVIRYQYDFSIPLDEAINNDCVALHFTGGVIQLL